MCSNASSVIHLLTDNSTDGDGGGDDALFQDKLIVKKHKPNQGDGQDSDEIIVWIMASKNTRIRNPVASACRSGLSK